MSAGMTLAREMDLYWAAVDVRTRELNGRAILYGEAAAREWLDQQPPIGLDPSRTGSLANSELGPEAP